VGKAVPRIAIKRGGLNCDARQVDKDAPKIATLREVSVDRCDLTISVKYIVGHGLEVVDKGQVDLWVSEVWCDVRDHSSAIGTHKVVLLSIAVK
jgi:hypothetical protein